MIKRFRLLPLSIVVMSMILGVKIVDFSFVVENSLAQVSENQDENKAAGQDNTEEPTVEDSVSENKSSVEFGSVPTRKEIEYLQKLVQRREELDRRSRELDNREKLLEAVEMRITERTESLKKIEETIEASLKKHDEIERAQVESLVKIYSAMKPKDAANIFNNLDEDVLIVIVEKMKEKQMGAILANMDLDKAKKLTTTLITRKQMPRIEG